MNQLLLVNDDDDILNRTAGMIVDLGWEVYVAGGEEKVFESIVARRPDLMIVDIEIECGGGFEAISTARRLFPDLFIIAVTRGGHESLWLETVCHCGANIYVVGPVSKSKLAGAINFGVQKGRVPSGGPPTNSPSPCTE